MSFRATIIQQEGHKNIKLNAPKHFYFSLRKYPEGKDVWVDVDDRPPQRSNQQNKYLWAVVYQLISEHTGFTDEEVHEWAKKKFLTPKYKHVLGENLTIRSTTKLSKGEFISYTTDIRNFAAQELGLVIPEPDSLPKLLNEI